LIPTVAIKGASRECPHRLIAEKQGTLIELGADLAIELPHGPSAAQGLGFVEGTDLEFANR
jgi:hypothetical protein